MIKNFLQELRTQRWDDHRFYHHSRINQSLHFVSAASFLFAYAMLFFDPVLRGLFTDMAEVHRVMADDDGIERLIERLEEIEGDLTLDA